MRQWVTTAYLLLHLSFLLFISSSLSLTYYLAQKKNKYIYICNDKKRSVEKSTAMEFLMPSNFCRVRKTMEAEEGRKRRRGGKGKKKGNNRAE
jgi:hypothetical protein